MSKGIIFFILCYCLLGCTRPQTKNNRESVDCDVVLISLDTLRADHLSEYGYKKANTPNLSALAAEGFVFEQVHSATPMTLSSHMSIMTGLYPNHHGVLKPWWKLNPKDKPDGDVLSSDKTLLLEYAKRAGYKTLWMAGGSGGVMLIPKAGFNRGVDRFVSRGLWTEKDVDTFRSFLSSSKGERIFAFLHSWRMHSPYTLPASANPREIPGISVSDESFQEDVKKCVNSPGCMEKRINDSGWGALRGYVLNLPDRDRYMMTSVKRRDLEDVKRVTHLYDQTITYVDGLLGEVFSLLQKNGRWERTIVAVVSDHGEEFFDHGWLGHGQLFNEVTHVPFFLRVPKACAKNSGPGRRVASLGSLVDVTPTILSILDIPFSDGLDGRNLLAEQEPGRTIFGYYHFSDSKHITYARNDRYKVISARMSNQFYDLSSDPGELSPMSGQIPETALDLLARLRQFELETP